MTPLWDVLRPYGVCTSLGCAYVLLWEHLSGMCFHLTQTLGCSVFAVLRNVAAMQPISHLVGGWVWCSRPPKNEAVCTSVYDRGL